MEGFSDQQQDYCVDTWPHLFSTPICPGSQLFTCLFSFSILPCFLCDCCYLVSAPCLTVSSFSFCPSILTPILTSPPESADLRHGHLAPDTVRPDHLKRQMKAPDTGGWDTLETIFPGVDFHRVSVWVIYSVLAVGNRQC